MSAQHRIVDTEELQPGERFSVYQFFDDGQYEQVRSHVPLEEAVKAAKHYCRSVAAVMGVVVEVIITDGGDLRVFEWKFGQGVTWPVPEVK